MTSFHMAWRRYIRKVDAPSAMSRDGSAMQRESSEQRRGSATITNRAFPFFRSWLAFASHLGGAFAGRVAVGVLLVSTAMCSAIWTGSIGAVLGKDNGSGRVFVREAPPGMGAAKAGIAVGDEVVAIEGRPTAKMSPEEVHEALAGKVGTKVKVSVVRAGVTLQYDVERGPLQGT
jgi:S1-C subfamily serine protease